MHDTTEMQRGTVKWYDPTKAYGFIQPEHGDGDVFVHVSALKKSGLDTLTDGQAVMFTVTTGRNGKLCADIVRPV